MGLDMSAFDLPQEVIGKQLVDLEIPHGATVNELAYWRKFHQLHGWMENLYRARNGRDEFFNCSTVRLLSADIDKLEKDAKNGLPAKAGFFFGNREWDDDRANELTNFITQCRKKFEQGQAVYYTSWW